jgi:hypothetical protein
MARLVLVIGPGNITDQTARTKRSLGVRCAHPGKAPSVNEGLPPRRTAYHSREMLVVHGDSTRRFKWSYERGLFGKLTRRLALAEHAMRGLRADESTATLAN